MKDALFVYFLLYVHVLCKNNLHIIQLEYNLTFTPALLTFCI